LIAKSSAYQLQPTISGSGSNFIGSTKIQYNSQYLRKSSYTG
jgi:hypothetical protein